MTNGVGFFRYSLDPARIGRHCFSRSSNAEEDEGLEAVIFALSLKRWKENRHREAYKECADRILRCCRAACSGTDAASSEKR
jgi:hypothetical protein